ncbi:hypothetical protein GKD08_04820 [Paeniclostridium sordellii]|uniref:hypothetical protein n=1 Tax=Paraclostridium sordellii TaxID=1505 RepID=UPI0005E09A5A|nr:hypothetical protein [Paeniclostridium sordellii]MDK0695969.1 hypothetical protein [Clostridium perfringens]MRZ28085.1 hypothetical protein [Paeniclostridium sordellii]CEP42307.1 Uncharacterised protein [[Clostridium] sordellii] [Paeniclostridium sordellii]
MIDFKNTIVVSIIIGISLLIQFVLNSLPTVPEIVLKLCNFLFYLLNYLESIAFVVAIIQDLRAYFKRKW